MSMNAGSSPDRRASSSSAQTFSRADDIHAQLQVLNSPSSPCIELSLMSSNRSLASLLRHGSAAEPRFGDTPLQSTFDIELPESDAISGNSRESMGSLGPTDGNGDLLRNHASVGSYHESTNSPADLQDHIGSTRDHVVDSNLQRLPVEHQGIYEDRYEYPSLPPSIRASSQHAADSSLPSLPALNSHPEIFNARNAQSAAGTTLPFLSSYTNPPPADSLEDLNQIGYGPMLYIERVRQMSRYLPHLKSVLLQPRDNRAGSIDWYDCQGVMRGPRSTVSNLYDGHAKEEIARLRTRLRHDMSSNTDTRVLIVSDLSMATIDFLGSTFNISPECFAEHLNNSGYVNGLFSDQDPWRWNTSGMKKDYVSVSWLRPVIKTNETPSALRLVQLLDPDHDGLQSIERRVVEQDRRLYPIMLNHHERASTNIIRSEFPLNVTSEMNKISSWRERATIWRGISGRCQIVVMITDPIPEILEHVDGPIRDEEFGFSINGEITPAVQVKRSILPPQRQSLNLTGRRVSFTRSLSLFDHTTPRLSNWFSYTRIMTGGLRDIKNTFHMFCSTSEEISRFLGQIDDLDPRTEVPALCNRTPTDVLFSIMENDSLQVLRLMQNSLKEIEHGTMNDGKLQVNLQHWRKIISDIRDLLPEVLASVGSFVKSAEDPFRRPPGSERIEDFDVSKRFDQIAQQVLSTLTLAVDTQKALSTNIAIIDSKRGIAEAEAVTRLTELAFLFIPLTFAASLFSMQVPQITNHATLWSFIGVALGLALFVYTIRIIIRSRFFKAISEAVSFEARNYGKVTGSRPISTRHFLQWAWARCSRAAAALIFHLACMITALAFLWLSSNGLAYKGIFTLYITIAFGILARVFATSGLTRETLRIWNSDRFLSEGSTGLGHSTILNRAQQYAARSTLWRAMRGRGTVTGASMLVLIAPLVPLWSHKLDLSLKIGVTIVMFLCAFVARIAFIGHKVSRSRAEETEAE